MSKYEHLLSEDPIEAFKKIEGNYLRYFNTAYKLKNEELNRERERALEENENIGKEVYLEMLPEYEEVEIENIEALVNEFGDSFGNDNISRLYFQFISNGLMRGMFDRYKPYKHQIGMMEKAFAGIGENNNHLLYKNTVITSGTGSGKTESFLLPLLADIFKEATQWGPAANNADWYNTTPYEPCQRRYDNRPSAIRGLILYPMNALVEDQMQRLREALDSDEIRMFMDNNLGGNRIYFGSYNGNTIAPKSYDLLSENLNDEDFRTKRNEVSELLSAISNNYGRITGSYPNRADARYISPRLGGDSCTAEMLTRWDMQNWAPDIMITNTSMLSIMLMRRAEAKMFEDTKRWLTAEDLPENERENARQDRIFHIVVDELHLYRGTSGSEVACLLRMLYDAIGLSPVIDDGNGNKIPNPQIKILASSASLGNEEATQKFLQDFFGIYSTIEGQEGCVFNVQTGSNYNNYGDFEAGLTVNYRMFSGITHDDFLREENTEEDKRQIIENVIGMTIEDYITNFDRQIFVDFYNILPTNTDGSKRPISYSELINQRFNDNEDALRGFLIFRAFVDSIGIRGHKLPRFRFHKLFKYIEGLWGELQPTTNDNQIPISNLSYTAKEVGINGRKMLELLRCENCGELFVGGNRKQGNDGRLFLTLNYPNLEQIPNFNPTMMVQNKSYKEYAVFWPSEQERVDLEGGGAINGANDMVVKIHHNPGQIPTYNDGRASWEEAYLNTLTGEIKLSNQCAGDNEFRENSIKGFLYRVNINNNERELDDNQSKAIYALPCSCPHCNQDYSLRTYTNSPIRSFRTGIDRSNQILSKEIFYQLDENSPKLIGFSDSREDAAKQALGIEKEHYRDMIRMLFIECAKEIYDDNNRTNEIIDFLLANRNDPQIITLAQNMFPNEIARVFEIYGRILGNNDITYERRINSVLLSDFIGDNLDGRLIRKLLMHGINPAGEAYRYQWINGLHWSTLYDFNNYCLRQGLGDNRANAEIVRLTKRKLKSAIFSNSFGRYMGYSILDAGIGYITCPRNQEGTNHYNQLRDILPNDIDVYGFVDAIIRVMGDYWMYPTDNDDRACGDFKAGVKRILRKFSQLHNLNFDDLRRSVKNFLIESESVISELNLKLNFDRLSFSFMENDNYIVCGRCGRVHPNMGVGFCTNSYCREPLNPQVTIERRILNENHFIAHDILVEPREPRKLHTEELTGQTDDIQSRMRYFKDLIVPAINQNNFNDIHRIGYNITFPIDMVCVTTTMEVGVDIGSLQAIFQGNMPPTRYNYQQRVGRGGRRGQAFSAAFTFCRGRSHDNYYYTKATEEMLGGIPATPTLSLSPYTDNDEEKMKLAIMKRVIVKELLHKAYANLDYDYDLNDTAGEFGRVRDWNGTTRNILQTWMQQNDNIICETVKRYFDQFVDVNDNNDVTEIINWLRNDLVDRINAAVNRTTFTEKGLASYLAENGFLPIYGLPSDSRNFYHGSFQNKIRSIDRSSEMAISEFAPGVEKTKDKGKYKIEGITIPIKDDIIRGVFYFFDQNGDALSDSYVLTHENNTIISVDERQANDELNDNQKILVIPQAYRTSQIMNNTGTDVENTDKGSRFIQTELFVPNNRPSNSKEISNVKISLYELGLNNNEDPTIWRINTNNGSFYTGRYHGDNNRRSFMFYENGTPITPNQDGENPTIDVALGAKKVTEMISLRLRNCPRTLNLSLERGNRSAIRAAFYSAAFLLQRALADKLDVQPEEIEICEKITNDCPYPIIYLSDALPNGAGIVSYLYQDDNLERLIESIVNFDSFDNTKTEREKSFMQSLLSHREECLTACQNCLLTYTNRGFHHVLDWRLGVGILRLMIDETYDFGFAADTINNFEELNDHDRIIDVCANKLDFTNGGYFDIQRDPVIGVDECKFIYHPLWDVNIALRSAMEERNIRNTITAKCYNTFKLLRSDLTEDIILNINNDGEDQDAVPGITLS